GRVLDCLTEPVTAHRAGLPAPCASGLTSTVPGTHQASGPAPHHPWAAVSEHRTEAAALRRAERLNAYGHARRPPGRAHALGAAPAHARHLPWLAIHFPGLELPMARTATERLPSVCQGSPPPFRPSWTF